MTRKAVILAGGKGTRLAPLTTVFPKPLMPLGETPIIEVILRQLARAGFTDVVLAVGYLGHLLEALCGDGSVFGLNLTYSRESEPLGTAGPLRLIDRLDEPFLVMNGDVLCTLDYGAFLDAHVASGAVASIATHVRESTIDFGVVQTDHDGRVTGYLEKPRSEHLVSMGVYAFDPSVLEQVPRETYLDFPDLVHRLLALGLPVMTYPFTGYWLDIGRHEDFATAQAEFEEHRAAFLGTEGAGS